MSSQQGNDDVAVCVISPNGTGNLFHYYNSGRTMPQLLDPTNPSIGYSNIQVSSVNGVVTCSFTRAKTLAQTNYYNLENVTYYLLTARGKASAGERAFLIVL